MSNLMASTVLDWIEATMVADFLFRKYDLLYIHFLLVFLCRYQMICVVIWYLVLMYVKSTSIFLYLLQQESSMNIREYTTRCSGKSKISFTKYSSFMTPSLLSHATWATSAKIPTDSKVYQVQLPEQIYSYAFSNIPCIFYFLPGRWRPTWAICLDKWIGGSLISRPFSLSWFHNKMMK